MGWFRGLQRLPLWGRWTALAVDAGMQVAGTALCDVLLCTIPHQSPTATASPKGSLKSGTVALHRKNRIAVRVR